MPVGHQTWTVLTHDPIQELASNLWVVEGDMNPGHRRTMTLARLRDGRVIVHNAIALDDASMQKIDAWGEVAAILVPNSFHRQDALIYQQRYPKAKVYAPTGAVKAASKATPCAGTFADAPSDDSVTLRDVDGMKAREGVMMVRSDDGVSAVYCDAVLNLTARGGFFGFLLAPTGTVSVPRATRWFFAKNLKELQADLLRVAQSDGLTRVIPGHGAVVTSDAATRLREAAERLPA
jgi:hypothetical protein